MSKAHLGEWLPEWRPAQATKDAVGNQQFQAFVEQHRLSLLDVALAARVRLLTVWYIQQGRPVPLSSAQAVRVALLRLTGRAYAGPIVEQDTHA